MEGGKGVGVDIKCELISAGIPDSFLARGATPSRLAGHRAQRFIRTKPESSDNEREGVLWGGLVLNVASECLPAASTVLAEGGA